MFSKLGLLIVLLATSFTASATIVLKPLPEGKDAALPDVSDTPIPCDQIVTRLDGLQKKLSAHELGLVSFLGQINQAYKDWYAQLAPLEGTTQVIPVGTFSVLQAAATNTDEVVNDASDNTDRVTGEMALIVAAARACNITVKPPALPERK